MLEHGPLFESILARSNEGVAAFGRDGILITANRAFHGLYRLPPAVLATGEVEPVLDHVAGQLKDGAGFRERMAAARDSEAGHHRPELTETCDGRVLEWRVASLLIYGTSYGWVWTVADVTARERAAAELSGLERQVEQARALAGVGTWEIDAVTGEITWSDDVADLIGVSGRGKKPWIDEGVRWADPDGAEAIRHDIERSLLEGAPFSRLDRILLPDGGVRVVRSLGHPLRDERGRVTRLVGTIREAEASPDQRPHREQLLAGLDSLLVPTAVIDASGRVVHANFRFAATVGQGAGATLKQIVDHVADDWPAEMRRLRDDGWKSLDRCYRRADGTWVPATLHFAAMPGADADEVIMRLHEQEAAAPRPDHEEACDPLTGLPIATVFDRRLAEAFADGRPVGVMAIDLDGFATVNASLGRSHGDAALTAIAQRIRHAAERRDVARLGGDEFAMLVLDPTPERMLDLARRLQQAIAAPLPLGREILAQRSSVGMVVACPADNAPEVVLQDAMTATRLAHERGGDEVLLLDDHAREQLREEARLEADLRSAHEDGTLTVAYQPVVDLHERRIVGLEALVRWTDPERGAVEPEDFIAVAERTGMIAPITAWLLDTVCRQIAGWRDDGVQVPTVALNVSAQQLLRDDFVEGIPDALARAGLAPADLVLELSERSILELPAQAIDQLNALHAVGVRTVLDHFGTGSSSLAHLRELPVHGVKLDRSFVAGLPDDRHALAIVDAVMEMSRTLGLRGVATGVETTEQLEAIRRVGCSSGQGFLFSPPLTPDQVPAALDRRLAVPAGEEDTVSLGAAAQALGVSHSKLRRWTDEGRLFSVRTPGGHRRIPRSEVDRLAATLQAPLKPRLPEPPRRPLARIGRLIDERATWLHDLAPRVVYVGKEHGWFQTPGAARELGRWLAALARAFGDGEFDRALDATTTLLRAARAGNVALADRVALIDGILGAIRIAALNDGSDLQDELEDLRRAQLALRRHVLEHADNVSQEQQADERVKRSAPGRAEARRPGNRAVR